MSKYSLLVLLVAHIFALSPALAAPAPIEGLVERQDHAGITPDQGWGAPGQLLKRQCPICHKD